MVSPVVDVQTPDAVFVRCGVEAAGRRAPAGAATAVSARYRLQLLRRSQMFRRRATLRQLLMFTRDATRRIGVLFRYPCSRVLRVRKDVGQQRRMLRQRRGWRSVASLSSSVCNSMAVSIQRL